MIMKQKKGKDFNQITTKVEHYYTSKIDKYGAVAKGVDWNSVRSQHLRFEKLLHIVATEQPFSVNDYGCGYGEFVSFLRSKNLQFEYNGFDLSHKMIISATEKFGNFGNCRFFSDDAELAVADYTIASGIFNVKLDTPNSEWKEYIFETLNTFDDLSNKGFAFNILTSYSDVEFRRPDLYYADALVLFDYCKRTISKYVTLLHDYPLFEFTILVRK